LQKIGNIIGYRGTATAVVHCTPGQRPPMNAMVVDERMRPMGRIKDVFGPVQQPYARVRLDPSVGANPPKVGGMLYLL